MATTDIFNLSNLGTQKESTDWNVDPKTQTVAGQLNSVISSDSPLMQQARSRAMQSMNGRGLANSSMALGAADAAMYDTALEIAKPDAMTFADAAKTNAGTKNQFNLQSNQITGTANAQNWGAAQDFGRQTARDATQQGYTQSNMNLGTQQDIQKMGVQQQNEVAKMALGTQQDIQKMGVQQGFDLTKMDAQTKNTLTTMTAEQRNRMTQLATQNGYDLGKMNLQQTLDLAKLDKQTAAAIQVADIEAVYKNLTQGSTSATSILNKMQDSLNALRADATVTDETKRDQMVADIKTNAMEALNLVGAIAGDVDLTGYVTQVGL